VPRSTTTPLVLALALGVLLTPSAAAQDAERFAPSGRGTSSLELMQEEGMAPVSISVDFGQPHLRGRSLHNDTDSLVPNGTVWRTGANGTTILETGLDLVIDGVTLPKGRYALFTLPNATGWKLILQADVGQLISGYDKAKDLVRADMRHRELDTPVESVSMWLIPSMTDLRGELRLAWGTTEVAVDWAAVPVE
jgi:hypothetical protein